MSTMSLRLPKYLHESAREIAGKQHISVNQLVSTALAEKISALATEEYLDRLVAGSGREAFDLALSKVQDRPPMTGDEII